MPVPSFLDMIDVGEVGGESFHGYGTILSDMDDIWSNLGSHTELRFDVMDLPDAEFTLDDCEFDSLFDFGIEDLDRKDIVHHDCMWSGTCSDKSIHSNSPPHFVPLPPKPIFYEHHPTPPQKSSQSGAGRSLLINNRRDSPLRRPRSPRSCRASPAPSGERPETPQSLDEEEPPQFRHDVIACCVGSNATPLTIPSDDEDEPASSPSPSPPMRDPRHSTVESDHSYTRSKVIKHERFENLGVQTPSDSEEEIDVVSVGTCQRSVIGLPTNPTVSDRHKLQRTVATAITTSQRDSTTEARVPPLRVSVSQPAPRKRASSGAPCFDRSPAKARRISSRAGGRPRGRASPPKRRVVAQDSDSETENVEKRSLHNDMERQRRIGLKNLFEQLKREVPATREKERAPKVVILREAAALCQRLQRDERDADDLKRKQHRLLNTVKQLRMRLAAARRRP